MRSSAHIEGHPIHPMLVGFPAAYLIGSAFVGMFARAAHKPRWFQTAADLNLLGLASAVAAAVPGLIDYVFAIPPKSSARDRATNHMIANLSAVGLFALARVGRNGNAAPSRWSTAAEAAGVGLLTAGGWLGGTLVYRNQIGVDHRYANAGKWQAEPKRITGPVINAAADDELQPGQMKLLRVEDRRIVLARTEKGHAAFDDRCTHKGGPLSDGALVCDTVQCPWHGSQFDVTTGRVQQGPADAPVRTYAIEERGGRVYINLDDRLKS